MIKKTRLKYPNVNEEINNTNEDSIEIELKPFENKNLYIIESKITGIAIKKAYWITFFFSSPANNPALITIPDRDMPGSIAIAWQHPKKNDVL